MGNSAPSFSGLARVAAVAVIFAAGMQAWAGLSLKADPGFGGTFVAGSWTPLRVLAENMPDPANPGEKLRDIQGELRVTTHGRDGQAIRFTHPIELPAQSRKLVELPVLLPETSLPVRVELADSKSRIIAGVQFMFGPNSGANQRFPAGVVPTVLVEQDPNRSLDYPAWSAGAANVQRVPLEMLPSDFKGYAQVRVLVIRTRPSAAMSAEQLAALDAWIEFGGTLIVVGAHVPNELKLDPWLMERMPAVPDFTREVRLEELMRESGPEPVLFVEWKDRRQDAETMLDSGSGPLAMRRRIGAGEVIAVSVDASGMSKDAIEKTPLGIALQRIHDAAVVGPAIEDLRARHEWSTADVNQHFNVDLLPNRSLIALVIAAFVLVVGPLNFSYLRRKRRLELAWVTIPAFSILFFMAVYGFGVLTKGDDQFWASAEILHLNAGKSRGLLLFSGAQFSPATRNYLLTTPPGGTVLPQVKFYERPSSSFLAGLGMGAITGDPAEPAIALKTQAGGYDLISPGKQWTAHFYQGERLLEIEGSIDGSVTFLEDNEARIEITNSTPAALLGATVMIGQKRVIIGDIPPGETWSERSDLWKAGEFASEKPVGSDVRMQPYMNPGDYEQRQLAQEEEILRRDYANAKRTASPFASPFEESVFSRVLSGSNSQYPIQRGLHPQYRARLMARQSLWQSGVKISPAPDASKVAGLVEVALPVRLEGNVTMSNRLRSEVVDWDRTNTSFYGDPDAVCSLSESFVEFVISPPELDGPVEFARGSLEIRMTGPASYLLVRVFNFKTGKWDVAYQDIRTQNQVTRGYPGTSPAIHEDWVNPEGHYVRVRIDSREPPKTAGQKAGGLNMPFSGTGISLHRVGAVMTFKGSHLAPTSTESPEIPTIGEAPPEGKGNP